MRKLVFPIVCILLIVSVTAHAAKSLVELAKKVKPAVVLVETFDQDKNPVGQGSGFFINNKGDLITNLHVIGEAHSAVAKLTSGKQYPILGIVAFDANSDIVRLRAKVNGDSTPFITPVKVLPLVGEEIVIVGNPLGLESTVTRGIVSAVRKIEDVGHILQISAPMSVGSSGSPVLNMKGQVVGVASTILEAGQAFNFAIPSKKILNLEPESQLITLSELQLLFQLHEMLQPGSPVPTVKAVDNPCLRLLPADWWLVGNFDCKAYFDFIQWGAIDNPAVEVMMNNYMQMVQGMVGIDPQTQVQYVTFFASGNPDLNPQGLVIVKGTFQNSVSEMRLRFGLGAAMKKTIYKGITLYEDAEIGYGFPEQSMLMLGSSALLRRSVGALTATTKSLPESLRKTLEHTNGASIVWLAIRPSVVLGMQEIKGQRKNYPQFFKKVSALQCTSFFFESTYDGFLGRGLAYLPEKGRSKEFYSFLNEKKRRFLDVEGSNVFLSSFLMMSDIRLDDPYVRWDIQVTARGLFELWETKLIRKPAKR